MLVARWRGNGGWFRNPNQSTLPKPIRYLETAKIANLARISKRLVRRLFRPESRVSAGLVVTLVAPSSLRASARAGRDSGLVVGALHLIMKPVPNVSAGKGDSPSRPTILFLLKDIG